jgi:GTP-binding protein
VTKRAPLPVALAAEFTAAAARPAELPPSVAVEVAFAGRSNVGKSTLLNRLMNRQNLARTSSTPGCTRTVNFFGVRTRDGGVITFVDLPGYGFARRGKAERAAWADVAERYLLERPALALVVVLVDVRRGLEADDLDLIRMIEESKHKGRPAPPVVVVATKCDRLPLSKRRPAVAAVAKGGRRVHGVAESDDESIAGLWRQILKTVGRGPAARDEPPEPPGG